MNTHLRKTIQQILLAGSAATFVAGAFASVGQQNPPPGPGQIPDYFGVVPNFANSPQPILTTVSVTSTTGTGFVAAATTYDYNTDTQTDKVMDVQVLTPGAGYKATDVVTVTGGTGSVPVTLTPIVDTASGGIIGFKEIPSGTNTVANFAGLGSGFKLPIAGSGIQKFVDSLPGLTISGDPRFPGVNIDGKNDLKQQIPVAVPDQTTFTNPASDYYEIAEVEYIQQLHHDLPPTRLRGYVQIKTGGFTLAGFTAASDKLAYASQYAGYLGPVIIAQKNRPVRMKLVNLLSKSSDVSGLKGKIGVPVDTTYMGADGVADTENRAALHLHGGNTPWISDGTVRQWTKPKGEVGANKGESVRNVPDMWFDTSGNLIPNSSTCTQGTNTCTTSGASNNPGDGSMTFFYTNEQSARLMFYHDHAEGTTRLNVYAGVAAGYVLQDPTEQALVNDGTLPPLADTIPLIIQEKTFVPDDTHPVLNFYGPFKSQLNSQDPTWRWGTGATVAGLMGNGDLWVPHVFMPNQNPGDVTGANAMGRWDYGAWFWPPFANLQNGPVANPYYDPSCDTTTMYCEGPEIPGVPNGSLQSLMNGGDTAQNIQAVAGGVPDANNGGATTESPSGTPEAFNDTPLVNGTAYPYINVDPKKYRLRILSVGNDRMLNLSLVVAASKNSDTTALGNAGAASSAPAKLCDGNTLESASPENCTEVKMVPFDATQNKTGNTPFPPHWYTAQKGGVTFDGRPSGVFDPNTRGPAMVQIGTEGGFLSKPVVIKNQPVNYEYNPKNILIGNIKEHALLLGPAERADVLVDFSKFAGSTIILYNDAGAPVPAWDLRLDYYTGNFDNTDTGGAFSVIPGYGPNSRTLMQFRVSGTGGSHPVDDVGNTGVTVDATGKVTGGALMTAVQTAFKSSQEPIIVPQAAYNSVYGINATDATGKDLSSIFSTTLKFNPLLNTNGIFSLLSTTVNLELEPKTIIEDWTMNWGRMNALLGTEVPHTTAINQTSIPQAFVDPPTELVKITPNDNMVPVSGTLPDGTQLWKITHNGVDSHAIHFHLFHVQLVNRVGWDGAIYPPEANELGWKDTVLMHPLSDVIVAMRPMVMKGLPFKVPNSHHSLNPALKDGVTSAHFFNLNPLDGNASDVTNKQVNYGWEYLWHCHILGHEENDMMRTIAVAQPPEVPTNLTVTTTGNGNSKKVTLNWTDNSIISNWTRIQRSTSANFAKIDKTFNVVQTECTSQAGCPRTWSDPSPSTTAIYYRLQSNNTVGAGDGQLDTPRNLDGSYGAILPAELSTLVPGIAGYANVTANSDWATPVVPKPIVTLSVTALDFGNVATGSNATKTVTLSNSGNAPLTINSSTVTGSGFSKVNGGCGNSLAVGASCNITVQFAPTSTGAKTGNLVITDNTGGVVNSQQTVTLSGTGTTPALALPNVPRNVNNANGTSGGQITGGLTWSTPNGGGAVASYNVRWSNNQNMGSPTTVTGVTSNTQINVGGFARNVYMQVQAVNATGASAWTPTQAVQVTAR